MSGPSGFLPYGRQHIDEDDINAVIDTLKSDWLTTGPKVAEFEAAFQDKVAVPHAVVSNSGTAALHLACLALDLKAEDNVIVPSITFLATANAPRYVGANVIFADVDPNTGLLTPETFAAALARAKGPVKAVFPVHLNGQCVDMPAISAMAKEHGIYVVEDACHALGTVYADNAQPVGSCTYSDLTCFSFHPVKTIAMGEGGMTTTRDDVLAQRLSRYRNHGMTRDAATFQNVDMACDAEGQANPWYYELPDPGFNYRASDINCALGLSQLKKLDRFADARRHLMAAYDALFANLSDGLKTIIQPVQRTETSLPVLHLYPVHIDFTALQCTRAQLMQSLRTEGIGTQVHYVPVHHQPYYRAQSQADVELTGADTYYADIVSLPFFADMTAQDAEHVVQTLCKLCQRLAA